MSTSQPPQRITHYEPEKNSLADFSIQQFQEIIDFRRIYFGIVKYIWYIVLFVTIGMLAVTGWVLRQPKIYESRAVLVVEGQDKKILKDSDADQGDVPSDSDFVNTVVEALTSRNIMLRVVRANNLESYPGFAPPKKGGGTYTDDQLASLMEKKVSIRLRRLSRVIDITVFDPNPNMACTLATSYVTEFLRESFQQRMMVSKVANEFLSEEAEKLKQKLEQSEQQLQEYKEKNNAVSLEQSQNIIVQTLQDDSSALTDAKNNRLRLEADLEKLKSTDPTNTEELLQISSVVSIPQVASAREELMKAQDDLAALKEHYLPKHPKYIAAVNTIEGMQESLKEAVAKAGQEISDQYESARQTESKMEESLKEQEAKALELNKLSIPYNVLNREVETDRALFESVVSRMKVTGVEEGVESAPYRLMEEPLVPSKPTYPKILKTLLLSFIVLVVVAVSTVVILQSLSSSIASVDDAERILHLPVLGAIPEHAVKKPSIPMRLRNARRVIGKRAKLRQIAKRFFRALLNPIPSDASADDPHFYRITVIDDSGSPAAEAYRTLRTSILLMGPKENTRAMLFTSAVPSEGKTFTSINTAVTFAQQGERTILIDADLRRPSIHYALLEGKTTMGLSDYLSGVIPLEDAIKTTKVLGLSVVSAGRRCPNPAELLNQADFHGFINKLHEKFDRIIIDSAPINAVSDPLMIAKAVSQVIIVVRADKTSRHAITRAIKLLHKTGAQFGGVVLNRLTRGPGASYYYYYYGDKYAKESVYGTEAKT